MVRRKNVVFLSRTVHGSYGFTLLELLLIIAMIGILTCMATLGGAKLVRGWQLKRAGHQVLAANLNVDFRQPVPLGIEVVVEAWVDKVKGRKAFTRSRLALPGSDDALVEATGLFISVPEFFADGGDASG